MERASEGLSPQVAELPDHWWQGRFGAWRTRAPPPQGACLRLPDPDSRRFLLSPDSRSIRWSTRLPESHRRFLRPLNIRHRPHHYAQVLGAYYLVSSTLSPSLCRARVPAVLVFGSPSRSLNNPSPLRLSARVILLPWAMPAVISGIVWR